MLNPSQVKETDSYSKNCSLNGMMEKGESEKEEQCNKTTTEFPEIREVIPMLIHGEWWKTRIQTEGLENTI